MGRRLQQALLLPAAADWAQDDLVGAREEGGQAQGQQREDDGGSPGNPWIGVDWNAQARFRRRKTWLPFQRAACALKPSCS
jgi:hypothetical protein